MSAHERQESISLRLDNAEYMAKMYSDLSRFNDHKPKLQAQYAALSDRCQAEAKRLKPILAKFS